MNVLEMAERFVYWTNQSFEKLAAEKNKEKRKTIDYLLNKYAVEQHLMLEK
jgi:hypothetical protein